jgi:hypothetical protein
MKNISKANLNKFVKQMTNFFLDKGAIETKPLTENFKSFVLETSAGQLEINIDLSPSCMYSITSRFENVELANTKSWFKGVGSSTSGKYNFHSTHCYIDMGKLDNAIYYAQAFFNVTLD